MNTLLASLTLGVIACIATPAAADVTIDFEGIGGNAFVNEYYFGGQASNGARAPFNSGVQFINFRTLSSATTPYPSTTFAFNNAAPTIANTNFQFTGLSFDYRFVSGGTFEVWSNQGASGILLQSTAIAGNVTASSSPFTRGSVSFSGLAQSFRLVGTNGQLALDNITFATIPIAVVPEPATWSMMLVGFGLMAGAVRYRRRKAAIIFA